MTAIILLGLLGIGIGGVYGLLGAGVVVGHKGSGLINLDQGALAMYPAFAFATMQATGEVFLPWFDFIPGPIDVPYRIQVADGGTGRFPAFVAAMLMSVFLGLLLQQLVFGPLRRSPPISKIIGSLGVLIYLTAVASYQFGGGARTVRGLVPDGAWDRPFGLDGQLPYERIVLAAIAILVGAVLAVYYRRSRSGMATRALEESETGVALLGYSPNLIARTNWVISTTITGLAGVLALDFLSLSPTRYTLFVVPALGAALVGNLTSPFLAAVGGVALGMVQQAVAGLTFLSWWPDWLPADGMRQAVPLLVIAAYQYFRGSLLPVREVRFAKAQPGAPRPRHVAAMLLGIALVVGWRIATGTPITDGRLVTTLVAAVLMLSSVVIIGYLGQLSLAGMAFAGLAAYLAARLAADGQLATPNQATVDGPGLDDALAALIGIAAAVVLGLLIGLPALRIRGLQLAVVTLAAVGAVSTLILGNEAVMGSSARSNVIVPRPEWVGQPVGVRLDEQGFASRTSLAVFVLVWLLIVVAAVAGLRRGATGRRFIAVRGNEIAAEAAGVDVVRTKLLGFGISAAIAGLAGVLISYHQTVLQVSTFSGLAGLNNIAFLFLGGVGRISGALLGALLTPGGLLSSSTSQGNLLRTATAGAAMIVIAVVRPDGLASLGRPLWRFLVGLRPGRRNGGSAAPAGPDRPAELAGPGDGDPDGGDDVTWLEPEPADT